jgi:hypothetical protein
VRVVVDLAIEKEQSCLSSRTAGADGKENVSFRRYVAANIPEEARRSQVTVWNPHLAEAGEQAQIDYGSWPAAGPGHRKLRTVWAFVMVLACSRHMFVRPVLTMDQRAWTECHVAAFGFFGGYAWGIT